MELHHKVQQAFRELEEIKAAAAKAAETPRPATASACDRNGIAVQSQLFVRRGERKARTLTPRPPSSGEKANLASVQEVMKKLHQRNLELSKELAVLVN